jgi:hypothetical protein
MNASPAIELIIDSGAFAAKHKPGITIDRGPYVEFIKRNERWLWQYVNLDVIPASGSKDDCERAAEQSAANLRFMKACGLKPIPVYHCGERLEWLKQMVDDGEPYIAVSLSVRRMLQSQKLEMLDAAFALLKDKDGKPIVKVHAMGITEPKLLLAQPWYSADSSSWSVRSGYGQILVPYRHPTRRKEYDYGRKPKAIDVGKRSQIDKHVTEYQDHVRCWLIDSKVARTDLTAMGEVRYIPDFRRKALLAYYQSFAKANGIVMVYVTNKDPRFSMELSRAKANARLLSYADIGNEKAEFLPRYVTTGSFRAFADDDEKTLDRMRRAIIDRVAQPDRDEP